MKRRTVAVVTGTRAEFGLLEPVMREIQKHPGLELKLIVTGSHYVKNRGSTYKEIRERGFRIDSAVEIPHPTATPVGYGRALVRMFLGIRKVLRKLQPDWLVVLGDRAEPLAATAAGSDMKIAIAHMHGGELTGHPRDNTARVVISRYAHLHLAATQKSKQRLMELGEKEWRIRVVGAPGLDDILSAKLPARADVCRRYGIPKNEPYILLLQHSVPPSLRSKETPADVRRRTAHEIAETLRACEKLGYFVLASAPNTDQGSAVILRALEEADRRKLIHLVPNLPHADYLALLEGADVLLGNSSSGIIEAPAFKTPVVNLGIRQEGRERAANVIDAPHEASVIEKAVRKAMSSKFLKKVAKVHSPYGDGKTAPRVAKLLATLPIDKRLLEKSHA